MDEWSRLRCEISKEWNYSLDISPETKCMRTVENMCGFVIDLTIHAHYGSVYVCFRHQSVGCWSALTCKVMAEDIVFRSGDRRSTFELFWVFVSDFENLIALIVEK